MSNAPVVRELVIGFVIITCICMVACAIYSLRHRIQKVRRTTPTDWWNTVRPVSAPRRIGTGSPAAAAGQGGTAMTAAAARARANALFDDGIALDYDERAEAQVGPGRGRWGVGGGGGAAEVGSAGAGGKPQALFAACFGCPGGGDGPGQGVARAGDGGGDGGTAGGDAGLCVVCLATRSDHAVYPCGHLCLCRVCSVELTSRRGACPVCRGPATDCIRIFYAG